MDSFPFSPYCTYEDIAKAIQLNLWRNEREERHLRLYLWWSFNQDSFLSPSSLLTTNGDSLSIDYNYSSIIEYVPSELKENLTSLLLLLKDTDKERLVKAEIHRHLGEFDRSISLLSSIQEATLQRYCEQMKNWCEHKNPFIQQYK